MQCTWISFIHWFIDSFIDELIKHLLVLVFDEAVNENNEVLDLYEESAKALSEECA